MFATTSPRLTFCPYEEVEINKLLFETEEAFFCSLGGGFFVLKFFPTEREVTKVFFHLWDVLRVFRKPTNEKLLSR